MKAPKPLALTRAFPLLLLIAGSAQAQLVDVGECRQIEDSLERFACYESLDENQARASEPAAPQTETAVTRPRSSNAPREVVREAAPTRQPAETSVESFGRATARVERNDEGKDELHDTIAKLERFTPNQWDVTLSNGQVWRQVTGKRLLLEEGDDVRIYPTIWGNNYRLSAENKNGYIEVRRLR